MNPMDNLRSPDVQRNLQFTMKAAHQSNKHEESNFSTHKNSYNLSLDERYNHSKRENDSYQQNDALNQQSFQSSTKAGEDELNMTTSSKANVNFNRFKNTAFVGLATQSVRRSLNEMTQQIKKSKEIHDLMVERQNIENMIINSKLWSPTTGQAKNIMSAETVGTSTECTSNVFGGKFHRI